MFYDNYIKLCNSKGISPSAAAEEIGFMRSVVTRWSNGAIPRRATIQKISDYFGVTVQELLDEKKETPPTSKSEERIPGYDDLSEDDKAKVRSYIEFLLTSQYKD